jgi:hypothetical protein
MNTKVYLWYLAEFFVEFELFRTEFLERMRTQFMFSSTFLKIVLLWGNVEKKYGRSGQYTDDYIIRHMRIACCITKAIDKHS